MKYPAAILMVSLAGFVLYVPSLDRPGTRALPIIYDGSRPIEVWIEGQGHRLSSDTVLSVKSETGRLTIIQGKQQKEYRFNLRGTGETYWYLSESPFQLSGTGVSEVEASAQE